MIGHILRVGYVIRGLPRNRVVVFSVLEFRKKKDVGTDRFNVRSRRK